MTSAQPDEDHVCFIIHGRRPYCFDFNDILALPAGFPYRNRFDMQWLDPTLRQGIEQLVGKRVLLTLRDVENNRLVPARWGRIFSAEWIGKVAFFEYHLDELIEYSTAPNVRLQQIIDHTANFANNHAWLPGTVGQGLTAPSVFITRVGNRMGTALGSDLTAWGNVVSAIAIAPIYERIEFLKIVGLFSADGRPADVVNESFLVRPNSVYTLKIFQHVPEPGNPAVLIPTHPIELTTFPTHITALRSRQQAVGKYDRLTFTIKIRPLPPGERTAMEIPHVPDIATEGTAATSLYIPIQVATTGRVRIAAAVLLTVGSLYLIFQPHLFNLPDELVRNVATVLFVVTVAGPSRIMSNLWPTLPWSNTA